MDSRNRAFRYFTKLKGPRKFISNADFKAAINQLQQEAGTGFEEDEVETLIDALVHIEGLASTRFQELLRCIIPQQRVASESVLKIISWIFTYHNSAPVKSVVAALEWIIGLVEYDLTDRETVHAFYHHFYTLLPFKSKARHACRLIYLLTKPSDVQRWLVTRLLSIQEQFRGQTHTTALLGLFKSYKPECVPEKVIPVSLEFAFKNVGKMNQYFHQSQQRLNMGVTRDKRKIEWDVSSHKKRVRAQRLIIPSLDYIHFESERYRKEKLHSILEFDTMMSLAQHHHELDLPCNVMSLLQNEAGLHIITFGDKALQSRLSYNLYYTLKRVFIEEEKGYSYEEKKKLLSQIVALEEYLQQGIPIVSRFLAEYLCMSDVSEFQDEIFKMVEWVTFRSYEELQDLILDYLRTIFLSGSCEVKTLILATLRRLVQNVIMFGLSQRSECLTDMFLKSESDWIEVETLEAIVEFVSDLCELGLSLEQGDGRLLNEAFNFFEMVTFLEERYRLPLWTMSPPVVIYSALVGRNALMLSRACEVLMTNEEVYPRIKKMKLRKKFTAQVNLQRKYLRDFTNCLQVGKCFHSDGSFLFRDVLERHLRRLSKYTEPSTALDLTNHFALLPYTVLMQRGSEILSSDPFDREELLIIAEYYLQDIYNLVLLVQE